MNDDDPLIKEAERIASEHEHDLEVAEFNDRVDRILDELYPSPAHEFLMAKLCPCWRSAVLRAYDLPGSDVVIVLAMLLNQHEHDDGNTLIEATLLTYTEAGGFTLLDFKTEEE